VLAEETFSTEQVASLFEFCVLIQAQCELGIEPVFWEDSPPANDGPDILRLPARG
jgi:hypothetical protein